MIVVLKELYKHKYDGRNYSIYDILADKCDQIISVDEVHDIGKKLEQQGYIRFAMYKEGGDGAINSDGIEFVESIIKEESNDKFILGMVKRDYISVISGQAPEHYEFKDNLETNLYNLDYEPDHLVYLKELERTLEIGLEKHIATCSQPKPCQGEESFKNALFITRSKIKNLNQDHHPFPPYQPEDPFTQDQELNIKTKLDQILSHLEKIELGQQVTFDYFGEEFEDLKRLIPLIGKKNWLELFKGKLLSWGIDKILTVDMINSIYSTLTDDDTKLLP